MNVPIISPHEKKEFIYWFLNQYKMKLRESNWILTYLANHHKMLKNVHFVRNAPTSPRGIVISSDCSGGIAFRFHRGDIVTTNPEKAFHDIRLHREDELFIELQFPGSEKCPEYAFILEENPFESVDEEITAEDKQLTERILAYTLARGEKQELLKQIDMALDEKDETRFRQLTMELGYLDEYLSGDGKN